MGRELRALLELLGILGGLAIIVAWLWLVAGLWGMLG